MDVSGGCSFWMSAIAILAAKSCLALSDDDNHRCCHPPLTQEFTVAVCSIGQDWRSLTGLDQALRESQAEAQHV